MECELPGPSSGQVRTRPSRPPRPESGIQSFVAMKQCHEEAHRLVGKGLASDEAGNVEEAKTFYEKALRGLNRGLHFNCEELHASPDEIDTAKLMQQKMTKTKHQIQYRLEELIRNQSREVPSAPDISEEPPSYDDAMSESQYSSLGDSIMGYEETDGNLTANATELFSIDTGIQIFYVTPEGYVSAPSYPSSLKVFRFTETEAANSASPPAFLKVGDWVYPLVPGTSPALHTNYGGYIFPDTTVGAPPGSSVGMILPDTVSADQRQMLEDMMSSFTVLREQEVSPMETEMPPGMEAEITPQPPPQVRVDTQEPEETSSTSSKISKGILIAADYLSWGVGKGAEKAGQLIRFGSEKIKAQINPEQNPRPVDPKVQKGVQYVRQGTHAAVQVSSYLVSKLGQATMAVAREVAPHIRKKGEQYLPKSLKEVSSKDGKSKVDGAIEVAASGLKGFGTVYMSLDTAARALGRNLSHETAGIVTHKYGAEAGQLTEHTLFSAGNVVMTAYNANHFGVKAIAKRAARDTGKAVLEDIAEKRKQKRPDQPPDMH